MSFPLSISFANAAPEDCPLTFAELIALLNTLITGELDGDFIPYVTGAATPSVDDQDKVWHRVDANGRPVGTYVFYSGTWRKEYSVPIGTIAMYSGDPDVDFAGAGHAGTVGGEWDGWQLCSGENSSPNLSDKFVVGAKMDDLAIGYPNGDGPWKTGVSGVTTQEGAGVHEIVLNAANTYRPATLGVTVAHWDADGGSFVDSNGGLIGLAGAGSEFSLVDADPGNPTPPAIPTLPAYYSLAFVKFVGY